MQGHDAYPDPSADSPAGHDNGTVVVTPVATTEPYVHPTIPLGLPHVVQFVEASMHHLPMSVRFVGDRMSRYANARGEVSIAVPFICQITGLGSKNTAEHHIRLMESLGVLEKRPGKGGKDRKSNTYIFLGEQRNWRPLPTERPGTDPWIALALARRENEELRAVIARLMNGGATGHYGVTDGPAGVSQDEASRSYEPGDSHVSPGSHEAIGHSRVTDGSEENQPEESSHSYENRDVSTSAEPHGAIGHSGVTDGEGAKAPEFPSHSYENADSNPDTGAHGAIGHSGVTDGSEQNHPEESSNSYEAPASDPPAEAQEATGHSGVTNGEDEGQQYLSRRARVEPVVLEHRDFYQQSFDRRGVLGAIEFFSRSAGNEQELMRQVDILEAGGNPRQSGSDPPTGSAAQPRAQQDQDRYAVGQCPDCGRPFGTYGRATHCTDCTERRRRESEA